MTIKNEIEKVLREQFGHEFEVIDNSHQHAGHAGNPDGGAETHFKIVIKGAAVPGKSRIEKHRAVIAAIKDAVKDVHSVEISLKD